ncbi:SH3 domain-containing protein [Heliorestis convoluta]|nr:SH3 domain-containing protein [Heliorestis convoluta]
MSEKHDHNKLQEEKQGSLFEIGLTQEEQEILFASNRPQKRSLQKWVKVSTYGVAFTLSGFILGQMVIASAVTPGSSADPLISRSYLNRILGEQTTEIHSRIDAIDQKVDVLHQNLEKSTGQKIDVKNPVGTPLTNPTQAEEASKPAQVATVTPLIGAHIRYGPGTDYASIVGLEHGTEILIISIHDGVNNEKWFKVRLADGRTGFIRQDLVRLQ